MNTQLSIIAIVALFGTTCPTFAGSCDDSMSQMEKSWCYSDYGDFLERRMVAAYESADYQIESLNRRMEGIITKTLSSRLQPSQVAFETYRSAHCSLEAARALGGSGTGAFEQLCRNDLTQKRISYLLEISNSLGDF